MLNKLQNLFKGYRMFSIGDIAPDFTLTNELGESVSLADYRGKRVLIFFYPKAATSG